MRSASSICFLQFNSPQALHSFFFMILWTPNACSDISKCQISITTLMTHDFHIFHKASHLFQTFNILWMCMVPQSNSSEGHRHQIYYLLMFPCTQNESFSHSVMYNIPVFCVVQNSCFLCCTKFLLSMMYNIPVWDVVP